MEPPLRWRSVAWCHGGFALISALRTETRSICPRFSALLLPFRRGDDMVGNPHRAQISQFELFELILLLKFDKRFPVEQFEAAASQSAAVPSPLLYFHSCVHWIIYNNTTNDTKDNDNNNNSNNKHNIQLMIRLLVTNIIIIITIIYRYIDR